MEDKNQFNYLSEGQPINPEQVLKIQSNSMHQRADAVQSEKIESTSMKNEDIIQLKCLYCWELIDIFLHEVHENFCREEYFILADSTFVRCEDCNAQLTNSQFKEHGEICPSRKAYCCYCGEQKLYCFLRKHELECYQQKQKLQVEKERRIKQQKQNQVGQYYQQHCKWCQQLIEEADLQMHQLVCEVKFSIHDELQDIKLSSCQFMAIKQMYNKSALDHLKSKQKAQEVVFEKGYTEGDLILMSQFIEYQAPIIIHVNLSKNIKFFNTDTEYRNLFQTHKSGGSNSTQNRMMWEKYLFGKAYNKCQPNERVKYGVMNYANDKHGMVRCRAYGESVIVLKEHVRKRCTISHKRTYTKNETVATLKYNYSVLQKYDENELQALHLASRGFQVDSTDLNSFKEIQIHGPIRFGIDVECIYTKRAEKDMNATEVAIFESRFGVNIIAIEDMEDMENASFN